MKIRNHLPYSWPERIRLLVFATLLSAACPQANAEYEEAIDSAMQTLDRWMSAFNSRNMDAWAATNHYPHVRFASGSVAVHENAEQFAARDVFKYLTDTRWDHSHWIQREVNLASPNKVHVSTIFQRFDSDNNSIGQYESLYIVTKENGQWGGQGSVKLGPVVRLSRCWRTLWNTRFLCPTRTQK